MSLEHGVRYSAGAFNRGFFECLPALNTSVGLGNVGVPTLILSGRHDWITPVPQGAQRLHDALPNSELIVFEESGHFPFIEESDRFVEVVKNWLEGLAR